MFLREYREKSTRKTFIRLDDANHFVRTKTTFTTIAQRQLHCAPLCFTKSALRRLLLSALPASNFMKRNEENVDKKTFITISLLTSLSFRAKLIL